MAPKYPLFGMLLDITLYYLEYINSLAGIDIVEDESKRLLDLKPMLGMIKVVEKVKENDELFNTQISRLIGKGDWNCLRVLIYS